MNNPTNTDPCALIDALDMLRALREWEHRGDSVQEHWDEIYGPGAFDRVISAADAALRPAQRITEEQHIAAVRVLLRANGLDGLPQRMLDAMNAAASFPCAA